MLKPVDQVVFAATLAAKSSERAASALAAMSAPERKAASLDNANSAFKALHGFYGALFLAKFATGELDHLKRDRGVLDAQEIWAYGLRDFDQSTVRGALARVMDTPAFVEFPPNMLQFRAICRACAPVVTHKREEPTTLAIGMSQKLRSERAARNRAIVERHRYKPTPQTFGQAAAADADAASGLDVLKVVIAQAVGLAGGNEAKKLHEFDVMFAPRSAVVGVGAARA